jgi:cysteine-rich repeat protein
MQCVLEPSETEPNDHAATANPVSVQFVGSIDPAGDVDVVLVEVAHPGTNFAIFVRDLGDESCSKELMDPVVEVYGNGGSTFVAEDDDSGPGYCSTLMVTGLGPDTHYLFVSAAGAAAPTLPYVLNVFVDRCGNTMKSLAEECDDGNNQAGDGCSPTCTQE